MTPARFNISSIESNTIGPAPCKMLSTACSLRNVRSARCPEGKFVPDPPTRTINTGLREAILRTNRTNFRGFPKLSRYNRMAFVRGSDSQYCKKSLPEISARLPAETKALTPKPRRANRPRMVPPKAPDCEKKPRLPEVGIFLAKETLRLTAGSVLISPNAFGPTRRMPRARQNAKSSACFCAPA
ncbi:unannotated protein [freshwater metagenome]|uniref:Unannotated protein n=1 Tax=freshwater metagenome TaxID=449393 RepID=A0A6J6IBP4_9ZZZZ